MAQGMNATRLSEGIEKTQPRRQLLRVIAVMTVFAVGTIAFGAEESSEEEKPEPLTPEQMFEGGDTTYANWIEVSAGAPGQLDNEIVSGGWHVLRADAETVFDKSASEIWPDLIRRSSAQWVRLLEQ